MQKIGLVIGFMLLCASSVFPNNTMELITCMEGENKGDLFGVSVSGGDFNGDGYSDVIVGASCFDNYRGRIYIYLGAETMDSIPDLIISGEEEDNGYSVVSTAGDVNGDGITDFIVGAPVFGESYGNGKVYIYYGGDPLDSIPEITYMGENVGDRLGASVSTAGDVNGDGYDDVIVSAARMWPPSYVLIFYGGEDMDSIPDWRVNFGDQLVIVSTAGDVNGDGYDDVVMSAVTSDTTSEVRVYFGGADMGTISDIRYVLPYNSHTCASSAGDVNSDGYSDVLGGIEGLVYLFFGGEEMDSIPDVTFNEWQRGSSVGCAGDINRDGYDDIIIGVGQAHWGDGEVKVFLGSNDINNFPDIILYGASIGHFGDAVSTAGDINGDGYDDIIVGEPRYFVMSDQGKVYVFAGDSTVVEGIEVDSEEPIIPLVIYPNPFRQFVTIRYCLQDIEEVEINIYDISGSVIRILEDKTQNPGYHSSFWNGKDTFERQVPNGVYFCRLHYGEVSITKKLTLLR